MFVVMYCDENSQTSDTHANRKHGEEIAVFEFIRKEGDRHGETESNGPGRDTVQLSLYWGVTVRLNDCWGKISVSVGGDNKAKVHQTSKEDLGVTEYFGNIAGRNGTFDGRSALIQLKSCLDI